MRMKKNTHQKNTVYKICTLIFQNGSACCFFKIKCALKKTCVFLRVHVFSTFGRFFKKKCVREKKTCTPLFSMYFWYCCTNQSSDNKRPHYIFYRGKKGVHVFFRACFFSCMVFFRVFVKTKKIRRFQEKNIKDDIRPSPHSAIQNGRKWAKPKIGTVS